MVSVMLIKSKGERVARLPQPGGDTGTWGDILNDFLLQAHKTDGTLKSQVVDTVSLADAAITTGKLSTGTAPTSGQVLSFNGSGLVWVTPSGGSGPLGGDLTGTTSNAQIAAGAVVDADVSASAAIAQSKIANLTADLAAKATDAGIVHLAGAETITGTKTFSLSPIVPAPTNGTDAANKAYVDGVAGSGSTPDADAVTKGKLQLAGDLGGTAAAPTVPALSSKAAIATTITGAQSVAGGGDLSTDRTVSLVGDSAAPGASKYYGTDGAGAKGFHTLPSGGAGETNTASNIGATGVGVFKQKTGVDLEFKKVHAASNKVSVTDNTGADLLDLDINETNLTLTNLSGNLAQNRITNLTTDLTDKLSTSVVTTKGDLLAATAASTVTRLGIGTDGQVLVADSAQPTGLKWDNPAGASADAILTVAATDTPAAQKANADYVCDGTADDVQIQAAIDAVAQNPSGGGEVVLLQGTYSIAATISVGHPSDGVNTYRIHLRFERGAKVRWTSVTGVIPLVKVESSDCLVSNPWLQGSGSKGNGYGIVFGGDTTNFGGRYTKTVYRSSVQNIYAMNLNAGVVFAVDRTGSSSSGDNTVFGGYITSCVDGILSAGFTNRVYGIMIATCDNCIHGTPDRNSHMIEVYGATLNQWANAAVYLEKDKGSTFINLWAEHTAVQSAVPLQAVLLGGTTNSSYTANNTRFLGTTSFTLLDETYAVRHVRSQNVSFENVSVSTNGNLPATAIIRYDATQSGAAKYQRITFQTGSIPAGWNYSVLSSKDPAATGTLICEAIPAAAGSATNTTIGDQSPRPSQGTYYIDTTGNPNTATYWAKASNGHIAMMAADTAATSGLKSVLQTLSANNVHYEFGPKRYHFLDAPLGSEPHAGAEDHASFGTSSPPITGLTFSGSGIRSTILSNRTNWAGAADTEPLSFTNAQYVTIRDMTVESCGFYKSTTDAIDFDQGSYNLVERVRVTRSRSRGIVLDGGDAGKNAIGNVIRDCIVAGRPDKPGLSLVSGGTLTASTAYRYLVSWVDMDLAGINTAGETKPSDESTITTDATNRSIRINLPVGPYTCTQRKVYRALVGSPSWVLVTTIGDNTTAVYTDTGSAGSGVTMPVSNSSTIPQAGIEMLGASGNLVEGCSVDGVGDLANGAIQYGINMVRKGSGATTVNSDQNQVTNNTIRQSGSSGIRIFGGSSNLVTNNTIINPGTVAVKAQAIRIDSATGAVTNNNLISQNRTIENQDANSWSTGKSTSNVVTITATATPTGNVIQDNLLDAGASGTLISDSGTSSIVRNNSGYNPIGASSISIGASPYTYTAASSPEAIYITNGTVSSIVKNSVTLFTATPATVYLEPNESIVVTYSAAPTMVKDRK